MTIRSLLALAAASGLLASCGNQKDTPILIGQAHQSASAGDSLYQEAKKADDAGKSDRARKLYAKVADESPTATHAPQARLRQAQLLEQKGKWEDSFKAYQDFIKRYPGNSQYNHALKRQVDVAKSAVSGKLDNKFLGMSSSIPKDKIVGMLENVRDNAPQSAVAANAQFTIGELHEKDNSNKEAIAAYRKLVSQFPDSKEAPEGQFRIGLLLDRDAEKGNQNQANVDSAREAFSDYLNQYPHHYRAGEARSFIAKLGGMDVQRSFNVAEFYDKTGKFESAKIYYRDVVKRTKSGSLHDRAAARLKQLGE